MKVVEAVSLIMRVVDLVLSVVPDTHRQPTIVRVQEALRRRELAVTAAQAALNRRRLRK